VRKPEKENWIQESRDTPREKIRKGKKVSEKEGGDADVDGDS